MRSLLPPLAAGVLALSQPSGCSTAPAAPEIPTEPLEFRVEKEKPGLEVRLSEDQPQATGTETVPLATARELDDKKLGTLFSRVPDLPEDGLGQDFALRKASQPPPVTGAQVQLPFPPEAPAVPPPEVEQGPLKVLRFAPEGPVDLAPHLSITFSQPMVEVTSQEEAARVRPVKITPEPMGTWRWLGTRTLLFDPDPRFPMATDYTVEVPAGTRSAVGRTLEKAATWTFTTPTLQVRSAWPSYGPHTTHPFLFLAFDQAIDPQALLPSIRLASGAQVPLRIVSAPEIADDKQMQAMVKDQVEGRYLVLKPTVELERGTQYTLSVDAGAPSAEGPRKTPSSWSQSFYTYHPLEVGSQDCYSGLGGCDPMGSVWLYCNNPLDEMSFDPASVTVKPEVPGFKVQAQGSTLTLYGQWKPTSDYTITVGASLKDTFGQTLGRDVQKKVHFGHTERSIQGPGRDFMVLDPTAPPAYSIYTVNHKSVKLRVYAQSPEDFPKVSRWMREALYDGDYRKAPPGRLLANRTVQVEGYSADTRIETTLDLSPFLDQGKGHLLVWVEPTVQPRERWARVNLVSWVQATQIGLTATVDGSQVLGWATSLADGRALEGVQLQLLGQAEKQPTGKDGLARLTPYDTSTGPHALVARKGSDTAILPQQSGWWNEYGGWVRSSPSQGMLWYVFDDRQMYRPGEEVRIKGWIRRLDGSPGGDVQAFDRAATGITWTLNDATGNQIGKGEGELDGGGGFDLAMKLPDTPNLGQATLYLVATGAALANSQAYHYFQIQEFRRPEFEVNASVDPRPYVLGEHAHATVAANYYAGGGLPNADASWNVTWSPASFSPPNRSEWSFGSWVPWWRYDDSASSESGSAQLAGKTDALGTHRLKIDFLSLYPPRPMSVRVEATVEDVNRQRWTSGQSLTLHPASRYVGLKSDRWFVDADQPMKVDAIVVDLEGKAIPGVAVELVRSRLEWKYSRGRWTEERTDPTPCAVTSGPEGVSCTFPRTEGGSYEIVARVQDPEGRPSETVIQLYVSGGLSGIPNRDLTLETLTLVPDKKSWRPGEVAEIFVQCPFSPAEGLYSLSRNGIVEKVRFPMEGPTTTLRIPITEAFIPNMHLEVDAVGSAPRVDDQGQPLLDKARRPAYAHGSLALSVPPLDRTLQVEARPRDAALQPGESTVVDVTVKDSAGRPVEAEVALVAADESVLALSGYRLPDPLEVFYADRPSMVSQAHSRADVVLANPLEVTGVPPAGSAPGGGGYGDNGLMLGAGQAAFAMSAAPMVMAEAAPAPSEADDSPKAEKKSDARRERAMGAKDKGAVMDEEAESGGEAGPAIAVRTDFNALALFAPKVQTDAQGRAQVSLKLPDSLTRYRIMAVAVQGGKQFGSGESTITARKPLMLRPSAPRFLNFGDRMELPLVVQNQTDKPMEVDVALRVANARVLRSIKEDLDPESSRRVAGRRLTVPPNDRREVRIPVAAALAGTARFQAVAVSGKDTDAATFELPVWTPSTTEAFATYGEVDQGAMAQPVKAPAQIWPQFGGLEVTTSSTALASLTDAVLYLESYPFECTEQIASKILAVAALKDVLAAFESPDLPPPAELVDAVQKEIRRIDRRQQYDGGFSFWPGTPEYPYLTVHVMHALVHARAKGFDVPAHVMNRGTRYLEDIERHIPWWYSDEARWSIIAFSVSVRHENGDEDPGRARRLMREAGVEKLPLEAQAWILPVLAKTGKDNNDVDALLRNFENRATETAATAQFNVSYDDQAAYVLLQSSRRVDAIVLDALMEVRPRHDLVVKVVRGLNDHRTAGRWSTTQENAFVLLAMDRYFRTYEAVTPEFLAQVWLGRDYAGEHMFKGRTTERVRIDIPMSQLAERKGTEDLVISKAGPGRLYYRVGMRYAPRDLVVEPADYGFTVERRYEPVDDPGDVTLQKDGTWKVRAGARVRVRVTMVSPARRYHVALVDPLPGGLEPMNPALAVTGTIPPDPNDTSQPYWWWRSAWYEHQNLRDERVEAFTSLLWDGVFEYVYVANATTPGRFVVPPSKAEEMYHPETFGRGKTDIVVVE